MSVTAPESEPGHPAPAGVGFGALVVLALGTLLFLNYRIATSVPLEQAGLGSSYLIFFYHFPSAFLCAIFFAGVFVASIAYLLTVQPRWDLHARLCAEIGVLACTVALVTGSTWASMAWNTWWDFGDRRLMFAAVMWLTYVGYLVLQTQVEAGDRRRRMAAVFGILAFVNVPLVKYAIRWFGEGSHPMEIQDDNPGSPINTWRWFGVLAFGLLYLAIYWWKWERMEVARQLDGVLNSTRRLEEGTRK